MQTKKIYIRLIKTLYLFLLIALAVNNAFSADIKVRVLSSYNVKTVDVKIISGNYMMLCNNLKVFVNNLIPDEAITLTFHNNQIRVEKGIEFIGTYNQIEFIGKK